MKDDKTYTYFTLVCALIVHTCSSIATRVWLALVNHLSTITACVSRSALTLMGISYIYALPSILTYVLHFQTYNIINVSSYTRLQQQWVKICVYIIFIWINEKLHILYHFWQQSLDRTCWGHHSIVQSIPLYNGRSRRWLSESKSHHCDSAPGCTDLQGSAYKTVKEKLLWDEFL